MHPWPLLIATLALTATLVTSYNPLDYSAYAAAPPSALNMTTKLLKSVILPPSGGGTPTGKATCISSTAHLADGVYSPAQLRSSLLTVSETRLPDGQT